MKSLLTLALLLVATVISSAVDSKEAIDPSTLKNKVSISIGQKLLVQFQRMRDVVSDPKIVVQATDKESTLALDFRNETDMLMLIIKNPFPKTLRLRALARLKGHKDYFETSILPVPATLSDFESWRDPIEEIVLFDFKLTDEKQ